ncbi:MAG: hypothetical protein MZV70_16245 [Desulfobacterales bacterium]|nr:hypothetical protein [Desulfobacterales bacterium]
MGLSKIAIVTDSTANLPHKWSSNTGCMSSRSRFIGARKLTATAWIFL